MDKTNSKMYINKYGNKVWQNSNGKYHKLNGPALEWTDGSKFWFKNGKYHRLDGPAREWKDANKYWWINNIKFSKEEFNSWIKRIQKCI